MNILKFLDISNINRISFRNDINGLRAIAVLSVVFYHADIDLFKGGWLGVDIFFVISGYLISNIIISELNESKFSFKIFYLRRIKRILPALFFTLFITIPFAFWLLSPKAMDEYLDSLVASLFFYANYYFMNLEFYIAESTKVMPFLHTWSLAIEEQYYILFPLFAFFIFKNLKKYFFLIISFFVVSSIYLSTLSQEVTKFYKLEFRIWELLIGVLVMILRSNVKVNHLEKIGFPVMLLPIFYFDDSWINHIEPKLISLFGISLIIFSNTDTTVLTKFLNVKIFSLIGLSSYSIYLLHQPLFAFIRIFNSDVQPVISFENLNYSLNLQKKLLIILILLFLGYFQYVFIEKKLTNSKYIYRVLIIFLIFSLLFIYFGKIGNGYDERFTSDNELVIKAINYQNIEKFDLIINNEVCHKTSLEQKADLNCLVNKYSDFKEILVVGDSHSRLLLKPLSKTIVDNPIRFATGDSCIYFINIVNTDCKRSDKEKLKDYVAKLENKIIIYIADLQDKISNPQKNVLVNVPLTLNELAKKNYVLVITQVPPFPVNVSNRILNNTELNEVKYPSYEWNQNDKKLQLDSMYKSLSNHKNIFVIDTFQIFCEDIQKGYCVGAEENIIFIYDDNHPSDQGAQLIVDEIKAIVSLLNK